MLLLCYAVPQFGCQLCTRCYRGPKCPEVSIGLKRRSQKELSLTCLGVRMGHRGLANPHHQSCDRWTSTSKKGNSTMSTDLPRPPHRRFDFALHLSKKSHHESDVTIMKNTFHATHASRRKSVPHVKLPHGGTPGQRQKRVTQPNAQIFVENSSKIMDFH
jgi:hypothetical protein